MDETLRDRLQNRDAAAKAAESHPDADALTAFMEQRLHGEERQVVLNHLSDCTECREVIALSWESQEQPLAEAPAPHRAPAAAAWWSTAPLRWGAAAAAVLLVAAVFTVPWEEWGGRSGEGDTAQVRTGEEPTPAPAPRKELPAASEQQPPAAETAQTQPPPAPAVPQLEKKQVAAAPSVPDQQARAKAAQQERAREEQQAAASIAAENRAAQQQAAEQARVAARSKPAAGIAASTPAPRAAKPAAPESAASDVSTEVPLQRARPEARKQAQMSAAAPPPPPSPANTAMTAAQPTVALDAASPRPRAGLSGAARVQWSLSQAGVLIRSSDGGTTWSEVPLAPGVRLQVITRVGPHIWVGGAQGTLYHSGNAGGGWSRVALPTKEDVVAIRFDSLESGSVTTATGAVWSTQDGGRTWTK